MALLPVGSPAPSVAERSIFPGTGLICHLIAGITLVNPEFQLTAYGSKIGWEVDQNLPAGRDAPAQPAVGAIELVSTVPSAEIDAVLGLETALRQHEA